MTSYIQPTACKLGPSQLNAYCPSTDFIELQGGTIKNEEQRDFQYVVHSCTVMNTIRQSWGVPAVTCVPDAELAAVVT